ncbi:hypothetical protein [Limnoglobus roseus]|uniref:hypothetical protein n=1 Tax=Limnoglobus roseus TaxID=2598579 RepID=UPI0011EAAEDE|nr:hypothetical protein [Limnoglobus roseus]
MADAFRRPRLTEAEWELFSDGLDLLLVFVRQDIDAEEDDTETGSPAFDRLTAEQKYVILADVATALRDPAVPMPHHTAANEGAIAAVVYTIEDLLVQELDTASDPAPEIRSTLIRQHLLAVATEQGWEGVPRLTSKKAGKWHDLVELFEELILWDNDHTLGDRFLDLPPEESAFKQAAFGITGDYYLDTPDEPNEKGLLRASQQIARLFGRAVPS